jgi:hypothetical protein
MKRKFLGCGREMPVTIAWTEEILSREHDPFLTWEGGVVESFVRNSSGKVTGILSLPNDLN